MEELKPFGSSINPDVDAKEVWKAQPLSKEEQNCYRNIVGCLIYRQPSNEDRTSLYARAC